MKRNSLIAAFVCVCTLLCAGCAPSPVTLQAAATAFPALTSPNSPSPSLSPSPSASTPPAASPSPSTSPTPQASPSPSATVQPPPATASAAPTRASAKGKIIAIDAGHQEKSNKEQEPLGPGSTEMKAKVASGTQGVSTKVAEYELNLTIAKKLREELLLRGYAVYMIRETNDVNISNKERADMAENAGADLFLRIHANGSENPDKNGIQMVAPAEDSPYIPHLYADSLRLAKLLLTEMLDKTGAGSAGIWETNTMSGINWSTMPVVLIEMGYMSNPKEDENMQKESYQGKLVAGMADAVDRYFAGE